MAKLDLTTYGVLAAEGFLKDLNIALSKAAIRNQMVNKASFYRRCVKLLAFISYAQMLDEQVIEIERFTQDMFLTYLKTDSAESRAAGIGMALRDVLEDRRQKLLGHSGHLTEIETELASKREMFIRDLKAKVSHWQTQQKTHAEQITQALQEQGADIPKDFTKNLQNALEMQHIGNPDGQ